MRILNITDKQIPNERRQYEYKSVYPEKSIVIDGVDVSGCKYFYINDAHPELQECINPFCKDLCKNNPNCYYKQLKRKEQDYEELRQYHNKCCEENAKKETEWLEKFNQISIGFYNGDYCNTEHCSLLKAKEQECKALRKDIKDIANLLDLDTGEEYNFGNIELEIKQLKAKEQECEELALENYELNELFDRLKVENEELKKRVMQKCPQCGEIYLNPIGAKLYETLTEIKEIAEEAGNTQYLTFPDFNLKQNVKMLMGQFNGYLQQILQKISEVENEHNG